MGTINVFQSRHDQYIEKDKCIGYLTFSIMPYLEIINSVADIERLFKVLVKIWFRYSVSQIIKQMFTTFTKTFSFLKNEVIGNNTVRKIADIEMEYDK